MKSRKILLNIEIFLLVVLMASSALAFAVSIEPLPQDEQGNRVLYMMPGKEKGMAFVVQNGGGATNAVVMKADISEGSEIIRITDSSNVYNIPAGGRIDVNTLITIPSTAIIGDSYNVAISFTISPDIGGIALGSSIQHKFKVVVGDEPKPQQIAPPTTIDFGEQEEIEKPKNRLLIYLIIAIIILIIIIISIIRRKKKNY